MKATFLFPDIGEGLEEGRIQEWLVKVGQEVEADTPLVTVETDKVVTDLPSPYNGVITKLHGENGDEIHVGQVLVEFEIQGEADQATTAVKEIVEEEGAGVVGEIEVAGIDDVLPPSAETAVQSSKSEGKVLATPVVRQMAKVHGLDLSQVRGTGHQGRVLKEDVEKHLATDAEVKQEQEVKANSTMLPSSEETCVVPMSSMRKTIAQNMLKAKQEAAHITVFDEVDISKLETVRTEYKTVLAEEGTKLTYASFVIKAIATAIERFPVLNARIEDDSIVYQNQVNMGLAVDTEEGLVVPVIRDVQNKTIRSIANDIQAVSAKARDKKLTIADMRGGTITLTSFGSLGGRFATPILNRPQSAIVGIGRVAKQPIVINDQLSVGLVMPLSLTVDHCIADGGEISRFLTLLMSYLNDPTKLLIG